MNEKRRKLTPAQLPEVITRHLRRAEENDRQIYTGMPEELKASSLGLAEAVRARAEMLMAAVRAGRRVNHGLPVNNDVEVYGCDHRKPEDVFEYLYWLGVEAGIKMLAGRTYGFLTGQRLRCFQDEGNPTQVQWESDGGLMRFPKNLVRDEGAKAPPYTPPMETNAAFEGAASYLGIDKQYLKAGKGRRDDFGGVQAIENPLLKDPKKGA